jgi:hypothetical protein
MKFYIILMWYLKIKCHILRGMLYKPQIGSIEVLVGHQNRLPHCVVMLDWQLPKPMCDHKSAYVGHDCIEHTLEVREENCYDLCG